MDTHPSSPRAPGSREGAPGDATKDFASRFFEKTGKLVDKWEQYLSIYEVEIAPYVAKGAPISLLEIGVQNGGSLELWSDYLPAGSRIVGIDIDPRVGDLTFANPNVSVIVHDATDGEGLRPILGNSTFDVIVDDGSHICSDVIATFEFGFDYLAPGGKFIIEDLHTSYYPSHEGGFREPRSSIEWLKSVVDALNADHILPEANVPDRELSALRKLNALVGRIAFYDSVAVVEKLPVEKVRPYRRLCGGLNTPIVPPEDWLFKISPTHLKPILFAHPAARQVEASMVEELSVRQSTIEQLRANVERLEANIEQSRASLDQAMRHAERDLEALRASSLARERELMDEIAALLAPPEPEPEPEPVVDDTPEICARVFAAIDG